MRRAAVLACVLVASGCGGGGGGSSPSPAAPAHTAASFSFSVTIPARATAATQRRLAYVSPSTSSIAIDVVYPSGPVPGAVVDVAPPSAVCTATGSSETCTVAVVATAGATSFDVRLYDRPNAQGNLLSADTVAVPAAPDGYANVAVTLLPVAAGISVTLQPPLVAGTPGTSQLVLTTVDADGNPLPPGPLDAPIALASSSTHLVFNTATVTDTSQPVTLTYDGSLAPGATITATAGATTYAFAPFGRAAGGALTVTPPDLMLQVGGAPGTFTVAESGGGDTIAVTSVCVDGAQIAVSPQSVTLGATPATIGVTAIAAPSGTPAHACTVTFAGATASVTATVDVNASSVGIQAVRR